MDGRKAVPIAELALQCLRDLAATDLDLERAKLACLDQLHVGAASPPAIVGDLGVRILCSPSFATEEQLCEYHERQQVRDAIQAVTLADLRALCEQLTATTPTILSFGELANVSR